MEKKKNFLLTISILSLIAAAFIMLSIFDFYMLLQRKEKFIQKNLIEDISIHSSTLADIKLTSYINTLKKFSNLIPKEQIDVSKIIGQFSNIVKDEEFLDMGFVSADGSLWTTNGEAVINLDITNNNYWQTLLQKDYVISDIFPSVVTKNDIFIVAVPHLDEEDNFLGAVHAAINVEDFQKYIESNLEISNYSISLIDIDANYITRSKQHDITTNYTNLFDFARDHVKNLDIDKIKESLKNKENISEEIFIAKESSLISLSPLAQTNWYSVVTISQNKINEHINSLLEYTIYLLILKVLLAFGLLFTFIFHLTRKEEIKQRDKEIKVQEKVFSDIDGIVQADLEENRIIYCSEKFHTNSINKLSYYELIELYIIKFVDEKYHKKLLDATQINNLLTLQSQGINRISLEYLIFEGTQKVWNQCEIHIDTDAKTGHSCVYYIIKNIDDKKRREQALKVRAETDELTGFYNRSTGTNLINQFLALNNYSEEASAFLILDLDNFKEVNDKLLHKTGDKALQDVAKIISSTFRKNDIVFRLGGDEFIIFMKNIKGSIVEEKAKTLINQLNLTYTRDEKQVSISASIGISFFPKDGSTFSNLYTKADSALYKAKESGKSTFCYYE